VQHCECTALYPCRQATWHSPVLARWSACRAQTAAPDHMFSSLHGCWPWCCLNCCPQRAVPGRHYTHFEEGVGRELAPEHVEVEDPCRAQAFPRSGAVTGTGPGTCTPSAGPRAGAFSRSQGAVPSAGVQTSGAHSSTGSPEGGPPWPGARTGAGPAGAPGLGPAGAPSPVPEEIVFVDGLLINTRFTPIVITPNATCVTSQAFLRYAGAPPSPSSAQQIGRYCACVCVGV